MAEEQPVDGKESDDSVIADRKLVEDLFNNLYESRIIYHERITILSEVIKAEITDEKYELWHRPIKLLNANPVFDGMYERWNDRPHLVCSAALSLTDHPCVYANGRLSLPYSSFTI